VLTIFLKSIMLNFYRFKIPLTTLLRPELKGYFFYDKFALRKNLSKIEVENKDWRTEFKKQVLPIFWIPQNMTYF
jgi:hypothetical protein